MATLENIDIEEYLSNLSSIILEYSNWSNITLTRAWAASIKDRPGVYALKEKYKNSIIYVGETGSLRGRMSDLLDSRHHTVRRSIGEKHFAHITGFERATTRKKFPEHIELMVDKYIESNLMLSILEVQLGRKELEEFIEDRIDRNCKLNKRGKRKSKNGLQ